MRGDGGIPMSADEWASYEAEWDQIARPLDPFADPGPRGAPADLPPMPPPEAYADDRDAAPSAGGGGPTVTGRTARAARVAQLRANVITLADATPKLSCRYLVKGWLNAGGSSLVIAAPNTAKSFLMLDVAFHIAVGRSWHGHRVRQGSVLYIAAEGGSGICNRLVALRQAHDCSDAEARCLAVLAARVDLAKPEEAEAMTELTATALPEAPALIVIDTVSRASPGADQNSATDMGAYVEAAERLGEAIGAHVCHVHHSGKDASRGSRGSTALPAAVDTEIALTEADGIITAENRQQRDGPKGGTFCFRLRVVDLGLDDDGDSVTSCVIEPAEAPEKGVKLPPRQLMAREALEQFVSDYGRPNPGGTGWPEPGSRQIVDGDAFIEFLAGKMSRNSAKECRRAARECRDGLIKKGVAQANAGMMWLV